MSDKLPFQDKVVLVTGSGRGIGRAIALHFAQQGAHLVVNFFRNRERAEDTVSQIREIGHRVILVKANLGEIDQIGQLFSEVEREFGYLDVLVCNAASGYNRPVMEQKPRGWDWTMNINARSVLFSVKSAVPLMEVRNGGSVVAISSPGSWRVLPDYVVVGASKAAMEAVVRYLAVELAPKNIVVNAVSPGIVETEALRHFDFVRREERIIEKAIAYCPVGRLVQPQDIAGVVGFLCSPAASMIRGQVIQVDGGYTLPVPGYWKERESAIIPGG